MILHFLSIQIISRARELRIFPDIIFASGVLNSQRSCRNLSIVEETKKRALYKTSKEHYFCYGKTVDFVQL